MPPEIRVVWCVTPVPVKLQKEAYCASLVDLVRLRFLHKRLLSKTRLLSVTAGHSDWRLTSSREESVASAKCWKSLESVGPRSVSSNDSA